MDGNPRLYVYLGVQVRDVQFEGTCRLPAAEKTYKKTFGFAVGLRSRHDVTAHGGHHAHGYYGKVWPNTHQIGFQKEFAHEDGKRPIYSTTKRFGIDPERAQPGQELQVRFTIVDVPGTGHHVRLCAEIKYENSENWQLAGEFVDAGQWGTCGGVNSDQDFGYKYDYTPKSI